MKRVGKDVTPELRRAHAEHFLGIGGGPCRNALELLGGIPALLSGMKLSGTAGAWDA
ncbi:hypothetical protein OH491_27455 (plasmid) [Termitidicoccus mucosus]|uniref:hypothetical protein n=1 Tax=Termitidicoccus mucosus TaxID=1184151 RepID=UPI003182CFC0